MNTRIKHATRVEEEVAVDGVPSRRGKVPQG